MLVFTRKAARLMATCATGADLGFPYWSMDAVLSTEALNQLMNRLERNPHRAEDSIYARLLRACGNAQALEQGRRVHKHVQLYGDDDGGLFLGNRLMTMYRRCGSLDEARMVFEKMRDRDVVSWTAMISAFAQHGHQQEALQLYDEMLKIEAPNRVTFLAVLGACDSAEFLAYGERIHSEASKMGLDEDVSVGNALMGMYSRCGSLEGAMVVFQKLRERDLISWNTAITANAQFGHCREALLLLKEMLLEGVGADKVTFVSALNACTAGSSTSLRDGRLIHKLVAGKKMEMNVVLATALVAMYGRCGSLKEARELFRRMPEKNVVSWNAMIAAFAQNGCYKEAVQAYENMGDAGVSATRVTFMTILNAITTPEAVAEGRKIHRSILDSGLESEVEVGNALLTMYGRCECLQDARRVFDRMEGYRDVVSWNAMISAYASSSSSDDCREAVALFQQMLRVEKSFNPNKISFLTALNACANLGEVDAGKSFHAFSVECGFGSNISVCNASMHMYASCGSMDDAMNIFESMPNRDVISWNTVITGYVQSGNPKQAFLMFRRMQLEGFASNQVTFLSILSVCDTPVAVKEAALINMYGKCGELVRARGLFDALENNKRVLVTWNTMITAYALHGCGKQAFQLFERMQKEGVVPDRVTLVTALNACIAGGGIPEGKLIHARIVENGLDSDTLVGNALVNMYAKCGGLETAYSLFCKIEHKDKVSWNGMIGGYAQNGHAWAALKLFWLMQQDGERPDAITFMSTLCACSHGGYVGRGGDDFVSMVVDHQLERCPEHYSCMSDMLGRAGRLGEAEEFVRKMPVEVSTEVSWMTLLAACEVHGDVERARRVAAAIVDMNPDNTAAYVALSNLYATTCSAASSGRSRRPRLRKRSVKDFLILAERPSSLS